MKNFIKLFKSGIITWLKHYVWSMDKSKLGAAGKNVILHAPMIISNPQNVYMGDNVNIFGFSKLIVSQNGKLIMKKNSGAAQGLTIVTGNHTTMPTVGKWHKEVIIDVNTDRETTVIVEEDVWLGTDVTILPGVTIGRGSIVGAGSVCRNNVPPYSIVFGNPAKVIGFKYTVEEILAHEKILYPENERISEKILIKNYDKYYNNRIKDIIKFIK